MSKYCYDEMGNRYETMDKTEILETFNTGTPAVNIFTGSLTYKSEIIKYEYVGTKPSDEYITKLINVGLDFTISLSSAEVSTLLASEFKLFIYMYECELYITNGHCDVINIHNSKLGRRECYSDLSKNKIWYFMNSSSPINKIYNCSKAEFDKIVNKDENTYYVVEDEEYAVESSKNVTQKIGNLRLGSIFSNYDSSTETLANGKVNNAAYSETTYSVDVNGFIGGINISEIFANYDSDLEQLADGVVHEANHAVTADNATSSTNSKRAERADHAETATNAVSATVADTALLASAAGKLNALQTKDFTSTDDVTITSGRKLILSGDYSGNLALVVFKLKLTSDATSINTIYVPATLYLYKGQILYHTLFVTYGNNITYNDTLAYEVTDSGIYMQIATARSNSKWQSIEVVNIKILSV